MLQKLVSSLAFLAYASIASSEVFFSDDFESGGLESSNSDGFKWAGGINQRTTIARSDGYVIIDNIGTLKGPFPEKNLGGYQSRHALKMSYPAEKFHTEKRFNLGKPRKDIWVKFNLRVPTNFKHSKKKGIGSNNKLFALWMDGYSSKGAGPTVVWEYWSNDAGGSKLAIHWSEGGYTGAGPHKQHFDFIDYPQDQGRWMELIFHAKASTSGGASDGVIELFRKWENENHFRKYHSVLNANIAPPKNGPNGWNKGYLLGWSNPAFESDTDWLIDNFTLSTTPFAGTVLNPPGPVTIKSVTKSR